MNKEINQKMSQFLDDELGHSECENLLVKIKQHDELKNKISRYQLMGHVLRTDDFVIADKDFADKLSQILKKEPSYLLPKHKQVAKKVPIALWKKSSIAIAASMAMVAVFVSQQTELQNENLQQQVAFVAAKQSHKVQSNNLQSQEALLQAENKLKAAQQYERFKAYLQAHNDDLYTHGSLNTHPLASVASYGQD